MKVFSKSLLASLLRFIFSFIIIFFVLPIFFDSWGNNILKIQFLILLVILVEIVVFRISNQVQNSSYSKYNVALNNVKSNKLVNTISFLKGKNINLVLYSNDIFIKGLFPSSCYSEIEIDDFRDLIKVFSHIKYSIIAISISEYRRIITNINQNENLTLVWKILKRYKALPVCIVVSVHQLFDFHFKKDNFLELSQSIILLNQNLKYQSDVNIVIDNMSFICGFTVIAKLFREHQIESMELFMDFSKNRDFNFIFNESFEKFIASIEKLTFFKNCLSAKENIDANIFINQINLLKESFEKLVEIIIAISNRKMKKLKICFFNSELEKQISLPIITTSSHSFFLFKG